MKRILFCSLAASAAFAADAASRKHHPKGHYYSKSWRSGPHYQHRPYVRVAADGVLVDRDGWRQVHSWDNTCFRTLDYLHSDSACGGAAGF